jgi:hypothetical protein
MNELELFSPGGELLLNNLEQHLPMMQVIKDNLPALQEGISMFGRSQSQVMDNLLTVSHPTPIRNLRQILAEVNRTLQALREANFNIKRKEIEVKKYERQLEKEEDDLERELIQVEIEDRLSGMEVSKNYISGAIRKLTNYTVQYNYILESLGVSSFDEVDFEAEEERYHIMKAFDQGLTAARSRGGVIDEGNAIYLCQIGINGASAQAEVYRYLQKEGECLSKGIEPTHEMILQFLNDMADKYKGCSSQYAKMKGMTGMITELATIKKLPREGE